MRWPGFGSGSRCDPCGTHLRDQTLDRIANFPRAGTPYHHGTRRFVLQRFPVDVIYRFDGTRVEIVALAHQRRRPGYWLLREVRPLYERPLFEATVREMQESILV